MCVCVFIVFFALPATVTSFMLWPCCKKHRLDISEIKVEETDSVELSQTDSIGLSQTDSTQLSDADSVQLSQTDSVQLPQTDSMQLSHRGRFSESQSREICCSYKAARLVVLCGCDKTSSPLSCPSRACRHHPVLISLSAFWLMLLCLRPFLLRELVRAFD